MFFTKKWNYFSWATRWNHPFLSQLPLKGCFGTLKLTDGFYWHWLYIRVFHLTIFVLPIKVFQVSFNTPGSISTSIFALTLSDSVPNLIMIILMYVCPVSFQTLRVSKPFRSQSFTGSAPFPPKKSWQGFPKWNVFPFLQETNIIWILSSSLYLSISKSVFISER